MHAFSVLAGLVSVTLILAAVAGILVEVDREKEPEKDDKPAEFSGFLPDSEMVKVHAHLWHGVVGERGCTRCTHQRRWGGAGIGSFENVQYQWWRGRLEERFQAALAEWEDRVAGKWAIGLTPYGGAHRLGSIQVTG